MSEKKIDRKLNTELIKKRVKPGVVVENPDLSTELNIVLSKEQIDLVLKDLIERATDIPGGLAALASDHCCVDASVGSSVAGPFSSVGSSVSIVDKVSQSIRERLTADKVKVNISLPQNIKIR